MNLVDPMRVPVWNACGDSGVLVEQSAAHPRLSADGLSAGDAMSSGRRPRRPRAATFVRFLPRVRGWAVLKATGEPVDGWNVRQEELPMHDLMVAATFIFMVLSPCLVALRTGLGVDGLLEEKMYE